MYRNRMHRCKFVPPSNLCAPLPRLPPESVAFYHPLARFSKRYGIHGSSHSSHWYYNDTYLCDVVLAQDRCTSGAGAPLVVQVVDECRDCDANRLVIPFAIFRQSLGSAIGEADIRFRQVGVELASFGAASERFGRKIKKFSCFCSLDSFFNNRWIASLMEISS
jgi:hypothetical protein